MNDQKYNIIAEGIICVLSKETKNVTARDRKSFWTVISTGPRIKSNQITCAALFNSFSICAFFY